MSVRASGSIESNFLPAASIPTPSQSQRNDRARNASRAGRKATNGTLRELVPSEQCTSVTPCHPDACRRCGGDLQPDATEPTRHQVWDLPPIQPNDDEYQLFRGHCPCCGITIQASLPAGVPTGQCGPRLAAFTGLLMGHFRQSKRRASMFLGDLLNIPFSPACTVKIQNLVSDSIAVPYEQLRSQLERQPQLIVDESPTKEKRKKAWLWVAVAPIFAVFGIFGNRSRESLVSLVGDDSGIIVNCDRAKMYLDGKRLQWCWTQKRSSSGPIDCHCSSETSDLYGRRSAFIAIHSVCGENRIVRVLRRFRHQASRIVSNCPCVASARHPLTNQADAAFGCGLCEIWLAPMLPCSEVRQSWAKAPWVGAHPGMAGLLLVPPPAILVGRG